MKKLLSACVLGLAVNAQAQTYVNPAYGSGAVSPIYPGATTVYVDRNGNTIGASIQQPQQRPAEPPNYSLYTPSPYTPDSYRQGGYRDERR